MTKLAPALILIFLLGSSGVMAEEVTVLGLFKEAAFLEVDGSGKLVRVGETWRGVELLASDSRAARLRVAGTEYTLGISQHISAVYSEIETNRVLIPRSRNMQYVTNMSINGQQVQGLVDTGANVVAMSARQADALGIRYRDFEQQTMTTASGTVGAWRVILESVDVGGLKVDNVVASIIEGSHPQQVLIGMSFLEHVEMSERGGVLLLIAK